MRTSYVLNVEQRATEQKHADGTLGAVIVEATRTVMAPADSKANRMEPGKSQMRAATDLELQEQIMPSGSRIRMSKFSSSQRAS